MQPEDPRHGTYAGAVAHWMDTERPCPPCNTAANRYTKRRKLARLRGEVARVSSTGTTRRLQALQAIGYGIPEITTHTGIPTPTLRGVIYRGRNTSIRTAEAVATTYDQLCMTHPEGPYATRSRRTAKRRGWLPPMAWDDIDNPDEAPDLTTKDHGIDEIVVVRVLAGDFNLDPNRAERFEILRRWPGTDNELERATGWNVARMRRDLNTNNEEAA